MGNKVCTDVLEYDSENEYPFVGRQNEIDEINAMLEKKDIIQVYGMTKIGKSRILVRLLNEFHKVSKPCFYHDFSDDIIGSDDELKYLIQEALADEIFSGRKDLPHETEDINRSIKTLLKALKGIEGAPFLLFLDNVNKVFPCQSTKEHFLSFLKGVSSLKGSKLKLIFTTSEKISLVSQQFGEVEIGGMDDEHIDDIIRTIVKKNGISQKGFDFGQDILGEDNRICMDIIVKECEGLPLAAYMVAMELTADEGMLKPPDVVQLLFNQRVRSLSLEYYPLEDRLDYYKKDIENVRDLNMYFFQTLNRNLDDDNRQYIDNLRTELTKDNDKTKVDITKCLKLLTQPCIIKFLGDTQQIDMHTIFRECVLDMTGANSIDDQVFKKLLVENGRRLGMDLSDKELENPNLLEKYVQRLSKRVSSNQNENLIACGGSCENVEPSACNNIEQVVTEEKQFNIVDVSDNLYAQTSDADRLCTQCNRVKQPRERCDRDLGLEQGVTHYNIHPSNINFCSCHPKKRELKCKYSVEDNESVDDSDSTFTTNSSEPQSRETLGELRDSSTTLPSSLSNQNAMSYRVNRNVAGTTTSSETAYGVNCNNNGAVSNLVIRKESAITLSEARNASFSGQGAISYGVNIAVDRSESDNTNDINRVGQKNNFVSFVSNEAYEPRNVSEGD